MLLRSTNNIQTQHCFKQQCLSMIHKKQEAERQYKILQDKSSSLIKEETLKKIKNIQQKAYKPEEIHFSQHINSAETQEKTKKCMKILQDVKDHLEKINQNNGEISLQAQFEKLEKKKDKNFPVFLTPVKEAVHKINFKFIRNFLPFLRFDKDEMIASRKKFRWMSDCDLGDSAKQDFLSYLFEFQKYYRKQNKGREFIFEHDIHEVKQELGKQLVSERVLWLYTKSDFFSAAINMAMRCWRGPFQFGYLRYPIKHIVESVKKIAEKSPLVNIIAYRGTIYTAQQVQKLKSIDYLKLSGFISTSKNIKTPFQRIRINQNKNKINILIRILIQVQKAEQNPGYAVLGNGSAYMSEEQILFLPLSVFKVMGFEEHKWQMKQKIEYCELTLKYVSIQSIREKVSRGEAIDETEKQLIQNEDFQRIQTIKYQGQLFLGLQNQNYVKYYYRYALLQMINAYKDEPPLSQKISHRYHQTSKLIQNIFTQILDKNALDRFIHDYISNRSTIFEQIGMFYFKTYHYQKAMKYLRIEEEILMIGNSKDQQRINLVRMYGNYSEVASLRVCNSEKLQNILQAVTYYQTSLIMKLELARLKCLHKLYKGNQDQSQIIQLISLYQKTIQNTKNQHNFLPFQIQLRLINYYIFKSVFQKYFKFDNLKELVNNLHEALELCEKHFGTYNSKYTIILDQLSRTYINVGQFYSALSYSLKSSMIKRIIFERSSMVFWITYHYIADALNQLGEIELGMKYSRFYEEGLRKIDQTKKKLFYENSNQIYLCLRQENYIKQKIQNRLVQISALHQSKMIGEYSSVLLAAYLQRKNLQKIQQYLKNTLIHSWDKWRGFFNLNYKQIIFICRAVHAFIILKKFKEAYDLLAQINEKIFINEENRCGVSYAVYLEEKGFYYLSIKSDFKQCQRILQEGIHLWDVHCMKNSPHKAILLGYLSQLYEDNKSWKEAIKCREQSFQLWEKICSFWGDSTRIKENKQRLIDLRSKAMKSSNFAPNNTNKT